MQHGDRLQQLGRRARGCTPLALLLAIAIGAPNARAQSRETDEAAIRRISLARSDVALVHELHGMRGMRGPNGEPMPAQEELGVRVLVKDGARWRTTAFNNTIVRPPEPAPRPDDAAALTLAVVLAHPDDEAPVAPILARYAREGVQVHMLIASDGGAGTRRQGDVARPGATSPDEDLGRQRAEEARCAAQALGIRPPVLLGFPDGKLGDFLGDRTLVYRLTQRVAEELARLRPDAVLTWGPDGGVGHPDHRIVSDVVTQLQRAGAPGVPERVFYMYLPVEGIRAMNPQRGVPPLVIPQAKYFTVRVPFAPEDLRAAERSMACHRSQFTPEVVQRVWPATARAWNGAISLVPAFPTAPGADLFR